MKRLQIYLDTNTIYGFVKEIVKARIEGRDFIKPRKIRFLQNNFDKIEPFTSFFSSMEIIENLEKELKMGRNRLKNAISLFKKISGVKILNHMSLTGETYKWFLSGTGLKDAIQVNIAKNKNLVFVSEDKKLVRKIKQFYKDSLTLKELKQIIKIIK